MASEATGYFETEYGRVTVAPEIVKRFILDELHKAERFRIGGSRGDGGFFGRKDVDVQLDFAGGRIVATIPVHVRFETKIRREARDLQGKLVRAIAAGTGLSVERISVDVYQVFDKHDPPPPPPVTATPPEAAALEPAEV